MSQSERMVALAGRVLLALTFFFSGINKITGWKQTEGYMASKGMPLVPFFLLAAIVLEVGGGLSVILGYRAKMGAVALLIFIIPATLIFHNFWAYQGMDRQAQMINFMKNVAIMGGLLLVVSFGPGALSLDHRRK